MQAVLPLFSAHVFFYQEALQRYASSRSEQKCEKIEKKKISNAVGAEKLKIQSQLFFYFIYSIYFIYFLQTLTRSFRNR